MHLYLFIKAKEPPKSASFMSTILGHILPFYQLIPSKQHLPLQFIHSESQNSQSYQNTPRSPHFPYQSTPTVPSISIPTSLLLFPYFSVFLSPIILSLFIYLSILAPKPISSPIHPLYTLHTAILALLHHYPPFSYPILPPTPSPTPFPNHPLPPGPHPIPIHTFFHTFSAHFPSQDAHQHYCSLIKSP